MNKNQLHSVQFSFTKEERLCSRKLIQEVFDSGKSFSSNGFRISWKQHTSIPFPAQVLLTVPKKLVKKAVHRNRIKRIMREVYRKHKHQLYEQLSNENKKIVFSIAYMGKEEPVYAEFETKIILTLQRLFKEIEKNN